ncbi:MAG: DNA polymerase subunit beta, partial [Ignavibacteria bacterium CG22_combo_CG10-13_8_21_14_all_37_15]
MLSETTVTQIKEILLSGLQLNKIILFGSQARGTADERSDVDLLVLAPNLIDRYALMRELRGKLLPLKYA